MRSGNRKFSGVATIKVDLPKWQYQKSAKKKYGLFGPKFTLHESPGVKIRDFRSQGTAFESPASVRIETKGDETRIDLYDTNGHKPGYRLVIEHGTPSWSTLFLVFYSMTGYATTVHTDMVNLSLNSMPLTDADDILEIGQVRRKKTCTKVLVYVNN